MPITLVSGNINQTGDDSTAFPDLSVETGTTTSTGVVKIVVGSGQYQKTIYNLGDKKLLIHGTLLHDPRKVILIGNNQNMISVRGSGASEGDYRYICDANFITSAEELEPVVGIFCTAPQNPWYGSPLADETNPTSGVVTVQQGGRFEWRGAGIVAPSGFNFGVGSEGIIKDAFFISENDTLIDGYIEGRHYISFLNSDDVNIENFKMVGGEFINRSTNTTQFGIERSQSAIAVFPNRVENFTILNPIFDGTNTIDVCIQSEDLPNPTDITRTKVINPSNGSLLKIFGPESGSSFNARNKNRGLVELIYRCETSIDSNSNIIEGKYYIIDTNNGERKNLNGVDDTADKIYSGLVNANGTSSTFDVVGCIVNVEGPNDQGADNTGVYSKDLRGKTNVLGEDIFELNFMAYNHNYKLLRRSLTGNNTFVFSDLVEVDSKITNTNVSVVRDRLKNISAEEVYDRYKLHLVDNYKGETTPLVDLNDGVLDFGSADVHLIERAGGFGAITPSHEAGTFYVNSAEDPNVFDPSLNYGGKSGDTINGNPWVSYFSISLDWRISFIKAGTYTETIASTDLVYTIANDTFVVHVGNAGETFDGGIRTDGEVFNTSGVIVNGGIFDSTGDSVLDFRNFGEWRLYLTEAQRDLFGATPEAQGKTTDIYKFNYVAGTTYWHWTRINKSSPWIPFEVTPESKGLTVVGITSDEILLSSLSALQSLPRHARLDTSLSVNGDGYVSAFNNLASVVTELEVVNVSDVTVLTDLDIDRDIPYKNIFVGGTRYTRIQLHKEAIPAKDATLDTPATPAVPEELYDTTSIMFKTSTLSGKQGGAGAWFSKNCIHNNTDNMDGIHVGVICDGSIKPRNGCILIILGLHNAHPDRVSHITIDGSNCTSGPSTILITEAVGEIDFINFTNPDVVCEVVGTQSLIHLLSTVTGIDMEYLGEHEIDNQSTGAEGDVLIDTHSVIDEFFNHKTSKSTLMGSVGLAIHELYSMIMEEASGTPNAHYAFKSNAIATAAETIWDAMLSAHVATGTFGNFVQNITSGGGTANLSTIEKTIYYNNLPESNPNYVGDGSNGRPYKTWQEVGARLESDNIDKVVLQTDITFPSDIDPSFSILIEGRNGKPRVNFNGTAYPRRYTYRNVEFLGLLFGTEPFLTYDSHSLKLGDGDTPQTQATHLNGDHYRLVAEYIEPSTGCRLHLHDLSGFEGKVILDLDLLTTNPAITPSINIFNYIGHEIRIRNGIVQGAVNIYIHAPNAKVIIEATVVDSNPSIKDIKISSAKEVENLSTTAKFTPVGLSLRDKAPLTAKFYPSAQQTGDGFRDGVKTMPELLSILKEYNIGYVELQSDFTIPSDFVYTASLIWLGKVDITDNEIVTLNTNNINMRSYEFEDMRLTSGMSGISPFKTKGVRFHNFAHGGINGTHDRATMEGGGNRFSNGCILVMNTVFTLNGTLEIDCTGISSATSKLTFNDVHASNIIIKNVASGVTLFVDCPNSNVEIQSTVDAGSNITLVCNGTITGDETKATVVRTTSESSVVSGDVDCSGFTIL